MGRIIWGILLTASLTATAQVAYYPGTGVTAPSGVQAGIMLPPQIEAGHIALPGSGTPPGAPVQQGANDPRNGGSGYDWIPGAVTNVEAVRQQANSQSSAMPGQMVPASEEQPSPMRNGIRNFEPGNAGRAGASSAPVAMANNPTANVSLADKARQNAATRANVKQYTNQDIYAMKAGATRSELGTMTNGSLMATNTQPTLDQGDMAAVNAVLARHQAERTELAQNTAPTAPGQNPALPQSDRPADQPAARNVPANDPANSGAADQSAVADQNAPADRSSAAPVASGSDSSQRLPQTSTPLPLMLALGFIAVAGGAVWKLRS